MHPLESLPRYAKHKCTCNMLTFDSQTSLSHAVCPGPGPCVTFNVRPYQQPNHQLTINSQPSDKWQMPRITHAVPTGNNLCRHVVW